MEAVTTTYKDTRFKSRLEARWAVFFDRMQIEWYYEPFTYYFNGYQYTPDFVIDNTASAGEAFDCEDPSCVFTKSEEWSGQLQVLEVKPLLDIERCKQILKWNERIQPGGADSQFMNSWQLAAEGADVWYGVGGFEKCKMMPFMVRAIDLSPMRQSNDRLRSEHSLFYSDCEIFSPPTEDNPSDLDFKRGLSAASFFRFSRSLSL